MSMDFILCVVLAWIGINLAVLYWAWKNFKNER